MDQIRLRLLPEVGQQDDGAEKFIQVQNLAILIGAVSLVCADFENFEKAICLAGGGVDCKMLAYHGEELFSLKDVGKFELGLLKRIYNGRADGVGSF
jgi:hypothetical protein